MAWLVVIGLGARRAHPENHGRPLTIGGFDPIDQALNLPVPLSRAFVCKHHEPTRLEIGLTNFVWAA
ncbi:hypothetical protein BQ8794_10186 [Mesorhizobium prunaredense]|uniref:Uncharacterized protein n=1 Tax=Mesorhizobium prunaredense TaxID=1631249 RepID=A0A1R3V0S1_9HYPH|nr:hypothetical protein BQ8794_10186 [Mesorhizobium prunaredense]